MLTDNAPKEDSPMAHETGNVVDSDSPRTYIGEIGTQMMGRVTGDGPGIGDLVSGTFSLVEGYRAAKVWRSVLRSSTLR